MIDEQVSHLLFAKKSYWHHRLGDTTCADIHAWDVMYIVISNLLSAMDTCLRSLPGFNSLGCILSVECCPLFFMEGIIIDYYYY